jgi:hypothetical protein
MSIQSELRDHKKEKSVPLPFNRKQAMTHDLTFTLQKNVLTPFQNRSIYINANQATCYKLSVLRTYFLPRGDVGGDTILPSGAGDLSRCVLLCAEPARALSLPVGEHALGETVQPEG